MIKNCLRCCKEKEVNESGYCEKCFKKVFKQSNKTTREQRKKEKIRNRTIVAIIILLILFVGLFCQETIGDIFKIALDGSWDFSKVSFRISLPSFIPSEENIVLTEENAEKTIKEYIENNKESDDAYYLLETYVLSKFAESISSVNPNLNATDEKPKSAIYGKTIKELIKEGKAFMEEHNIKIEDVKKSIKQYNLDIDI